MRTLARRAVRLSAEQLHFHRPYEHAWSEIPRRRRRRQRAAESPEQDAEAAPPPPRVSFLAALLHGLLAAVGLRSPPQPTMTEEEFLKKHCNNVSASKLLQGVEQAYYALAVAIGEHAAQIAAYESISPSSARRQLCRCIGHLPATERAMRRLQKHPRHALAHIAHPSDELVDSYVEALGLRKEPGAPDVPVMKVRLAVRMTGSVYFGGDFEKVRKATVVTDVSPERAQELRDAFACMLCNWGLRVRDRPPQLQVYHRMLFQIQHEERLFIGKSMQLCLRMCQSLAPGLVGIPIVDKVWFFEFRDGVWYLDDAIPGLMPSLPPGTPDSGRQDDA
eukprot:TRINITY_DN70836_c0_g1_i1.p1 TRINITY_DN70836_c0_g1~~TRINITY_DN70836_c0_g1_i1.p1  ORF type:complete len:334 (+),score=97.55 TRINITY_DN70836_c0_g1_i1:116-1117(+)